MTCNGKTRRGGVEKHRKTEYCQEFYPDVKAIFRLSKMEERR